jgi:hypothetical protein
MANPIYTWGSTAQERSAGYPCDRHLSQPDLELFRAVDVDAPDAVVFRWLCQLRAAPYSYDLLDNRGRPSPGELTPGLDQLDVGQRVMTIFRLEEFVPQRSLTISYEGRVFGRIAGTYHVSPASERASRLVVKLLARLPATPGGRLLRLTLPAGDLFMMRRQLLNLKQLAERQSGPAQPSAPGAIPS